LKISAHLPRFRRRQFPASREFNREFAKLCRICLFSGYWSGGSRDISGRWT
jgi:hypothetical protein